MIKINHLLLISAALFIHKISFAQSNTAQASFDHILFFVKNEKVEKDLTNRFFTAAEKMSSEHPAQGTRGSYILFLNTYIEFLYFTDTTAALNNQQNFGSKYTQRWLNENACPFGFGLVLQPFDTVNVSSALHHYRAGHYSSYLLPKTNRDLRQPFLYYSPPERAHQTLKSLDEINTKVEEFKRQDLRNYLNHPSGMKELTGIKLLLPKAEMTAKNVESLNKLPIIELEVAPVYKLVLIFDEGAQGKSFIPKGGLNLEIQY